MKKLITLAAILGMALLMAASAWAEAEPALPIYYPSIIASSTQPSPGRTNYLDNKGALVGYTKTNSSGGVDFFDGGGNKLGYSKVHASGMVEYFDGKGGRIGVRQPK